MIFYEEKPLTVFVSQMRGNSYVTINAGAKEADGVWSVESFTLTFDHRPAFSEVLDAIGEDRAESLTNDELTALFRTFGASEEEQLAAVRQHVLRKITAWDRSDNVNKFTFGGVPTWLDKATRVGLKLRFESEKALGREATTLWLGTEQVTLPIGDAMRLLYVIEGYASDCFDKTEEHKKNVMTLASVDEVMSYDYTSGYPDKLCL